MQHWCEGHRGLVSHTYVVARFSPIGIPLGTWRVCKRCMKHCRSTPLQSLIGDKAVYTSPDVERQEFEIRLTPCEVGGLRVKGYDVRRCKNE